jgi:hypothetical protein
LGKQSPYHFAQPVSPNEKHIFHFRFKIGNRCNPCQQSVSAHPAPEKTKEIKLLKKQFFIDKNGFLRRFFRRKNRVKTSAKNRRKPIASLEDFNNAPKGRMSVSFVGSKNIILIWPSNQSNHQSYLNHGKESHQKSSSQKESCSKEAG